MGAPSGTGPTTTPPGDDLIKRVDLIATRLILEQNFQDMKALTNPTKCSERIFATAEALAKNMPQVDVSTLASRIQGVTGTKIATLNKTEVSKLETVSSDEKKKLCMTVAEFYIKVAHIFDAIALTVKPTFTFKDLSGNIVTKQLNEKAYIGQNSSVNTTQPGGLCARRLAQLSSNGVPEPVQTTVFAVKPNFCTPTRSTFGQETGVPELERLYFDVYDYERGTFTKMSPAMQQQYEQDVLQFYTVFTGDTNVTSANVPRRFSDIHLQDYSKQNVCTRSNPYLLLDPNEINPSIQAYAMHLRDMLTRANRNQARLLKILDDLFVVNADNQVTLNPSLNQASLDVITDQTRRIIVDLYRDCETDFVKGIKLYEAIVEQQIFVQAEQDPITPLLESYVMDPIKVAMQKSTLIANTQSGQLPILRPPVYRPVPENQPVRPEIAYFNPNKPASQVRNPLFLNIAKANVALNKGILKQPTGFAQDLTKLADVSNV